MESSIETNNNDNDGQMKSGQQFEDNDQQKSNEINLLQSFIDNRIDFDNLDTVSICEYLFEYCCLSYGSIDINNFNNSIELFIKNCHKKSIELNHFLALFDSYLFVQKYISLNASFNFDIFLKFCEIYYPNKIGIEDVGRIFFTIPWNHNYDFQFDFIKFCIENDRIIAIFESCSDLNLNKEIAEWKKSLNEQQQHSSDLLCWKYSSLYWILIELSKKGKLYTKIENLFIDKPIEKCPDLVIYAMIMQMQQQQQNDEPLKLVNALMIRAIKKIIYPGNNNSTYHNNSNLLIQKLWSTMVPSEATSLTIYQKMILKSLVELYTQAVTLDDQTNKLLRILEISQDLKALNYLLNESSYLFVIDLASVASRREYLKLDKWINDRLQTIGESFADACKFYVKQRSSIKSEANKKLSTPSHRETLGIITSCLENYYAKTKETSYTRNMKDVFKMYSELDTINKNYNSDVNNEDTCRNDPSKLISKNSQSLEANVFDSKVQKVATNFLKTIIFQSNLDRSKFNIIINHLEDMKYSNDFDSQLKFNCIIQTLLKDLDFLTQYQSNELVNIGEIIGGIINRSLIDNNLFSLVLQKLYYIINASKKDQKLLIFVDRVMETCKQRLQEYPTLFEKLLSIDQKMIARQRKVVSNDAPHQQPKHDKNSINIQPNSNITKQQQLSENQEFLFRERLNFIFNNLDRKNLPLIASQLIQDCQGNPRNYHLLSECLTCRAINETNHHELFYDLIDTIDLVEIFDVVTNKSYEKIRYYLPRIEKNNDLKKKLNSAGKWIGMITLSRNKPILSIHLDLHSLLIEAEIKNLTFQIVPFVVQILNACSKSKIFRPPNPWLMTLLQLLIHIYTKPDSKLKIKFEIEKLYQSLELKLDEHINKFSKTNIDIEKKKNLLKYFEYLEPSVLSHNTVESSTDNIVAQQQMIKSDNEIELFKELSDQIIISSQLKIIQYHPDLIVIFKKLIINAIQEWLKNRSETPSHLLNAVDIIIRKDFAFESDVRKIQMAAINFTRYVMASYIMMSCHESLSTTISEKLCDYLLNDHKLDRVLCDKEFIENTIIQIVNENLNSCITFIEKCLTKKAIIEICGRLKSDFENRSMIYENAKNLMDYDCSKLTAFYNTFDTVKLKQMQRIARSNKDVSSDDPQNLCDNNVIVKKQKESIQPPLNNSNRNNEQMFKVITILEKWFNFFHNDQKNDEEIHKAIMQVDFFKGEESLFTFLKLSFNICYEHCQQVIASQSSESANNASKIHMKCFNYLDSFTYLFLFLIKHESIQFKINVLNRFLSDFRAKVHADHNKNVGKFNPICYYRIMVLLFLEFNNEISSYANSNNNNNYLHIKSCLMQIFFDLLKSMSPLYLPTFTFAWLEFISHRSFIGHCLNGQNINGMWNHYYFLIRDLLEFEKSIIQINSIKSESFKHLHKGTVKLFLLLLHDFPDFLSRFCFLICDYLPKNSFQLHNIVLSASPQSYNLPNPLSSAINLDNFHKIIFNFDGKFDADLPFKNDVEAYLNTGQFFYSHKIQSYFEMTKHIPTQIDYINKLLYSITEHIVRENRDINMFSICNEPSTKLIKCLIEMFDSERLYHLFSSMINHLRFPNIDCKYFICLLLYFFRDYIQLKEFIFRVLIERLIAIGPRPWGLFYFVKELTNNPEYNFNKFLNNFNSQGLPDFCAKINLLTKQNN